VVKQLARYQNANVYTGKAKKIIVTAKQNRTSQVGQYAENMRQCWFGHVNTQMSDSRIPTQAVISIIIVGRFSRSGRALGRVCVGGK